MAELMEQLPSYEAKSFALWVAKATEKYFENPDVKRRFEAWKEAERARTAERTTSNGMKERLG